MFNALLAFVFVFLKPSLALIIAPSPCQQQHSFVGHAAKLHCSRITSSTTLLASKLDGDNESTLAQMSSERNVGIFVLLTVPLAWGTFEPAVRYVYAIRPAVPGFVFSVAYYLVAASALSALAGLSMMRQEENPTMSSEDEASATSSLPIRGGLELGTYLFVGNALQVIGLVNTPSDRAAFLLQLTTVSFALY